MLFLRRIEFRKWLPPEDQSWLASDDIPADPLGDLATKDNNLSIWHIEDDRSNFHRVVTAFAAKLGNVKTFEYSLFDGQLLADLELKRDKTQGDSKDDEVNQRWHWDVVHVSGDRLLKLAKALFALSSRNERGVVFEPQVEKLIREAVSSRRIELGSLEPGVKKRIDKLLGRP